MQKISTNIGSSIIIQREFNTPLLATKNNLTKTTIDIKDMINTINYFNEILFEKPCAIVVEHTYFSHVHGLIIKTCHMLGIKQVLIIFFKKIEIREGIFFVEHRIKAEINNSEIFRENKYLENNNIFLNNV